MLLSPISVDTTAHLGFVSSLPSSGGEATGFAKLLSSVESPGDASASPSQTAGGRAITPTNDIRRRSSQQNPSQGQESTASPVRSKLTGGQGQTPNVSLTGSLFSSSAFSGSFGNLILPIQSARFITSAPAATQSIARQFPDGESNHSIVASSGERLLRLPTGQKVSSDRDDGAPAADEIAFAVKVQPVKPLPACTGESGTDPAKTADALMRPVRDGNVFQTSGGISPLNGQTASPASVVTDVIDKSPVRTDTPVIADDAVGGTPLTATASANEIPARVESVFSRNGATSIAPASTGKQTEPSTSGKTSATNTENAGGAQNSAVHGARPTKDNSGDQNRSGTNDANSATPDKKSSVDAGSHINSGTASDSWPGVQAGQGNFETSRQLDGPAGKSAAPAPPATIMADQPIAPGQPVMPGAPMKDIAVRVETAAGQNVDVRIVQRAGDLQIAVTAADVDTTQGLRHGLSELTNRLNESGYHAETWRPGQAAATSEPSAESGNSSQHHPPSGNSQSNSGWSQQNSGQRQNNPSNRPRWVQELDSKLTGAAESTGQFHGFID